jgi:hypothetical protein
MRPFLPLALTALVLLAGCLADRSGGAADTTPPVAESIEVTSLDAPAAASAPMAQAEAAEAAVAATQAPKMSAEALAAETPATPPETEALLEEMAAPPPPEPVKSASQIACEKKGGRFATAGNSTTFVCVRETRDGGKSCNRETDCEGLCLARSRSCSPITPVLGCQEILTQDGLRVTQCVE